MPKTRRITYSITLYVHHTEINLPSAVYPRRGFMNEKRVVRASRVTPPSSINQEGKKLRSVPRYPPEPGAVLLSSLPSQSESEWQHFLRRSRSTGRGTSFVFRSVDPSSRTPAGKILRTRVLNPTRANRFKIDGLLSQNEESFSSDDQGSAAFSAAVVSTAYSRAR